MAFKRYAVLITITCCGLDFFYDRFIIARTYNEARKIAKKLAHAAEKKHRAEFTSGSVTEIKILEE